MAAAKSCNNRRRDTNSIAATESSLFKYKDNQRLDAWLTVLGSFLVYYSSIGLLNSFGYFQDYYQNDFLASTSASPSTISLIGTLQLTAMNMFAMISGAICDAHGVRYLYISSSLGTAIALVALSFSKPTITHVFLSQGLLMGLSIAFGVQPALTVVGQHFVEKRALAMGIVCAGAAAGGSSFSIMFIQLCPVIGFPWTMRIAALKVIFCYSIALAISSSKPSGKRINCGTLLDLGGFKDQRYVVLAVGAWFVSLGVWVPSYYIQSYAAHIYPRDAMSQYLIVLLNGCSIPGMIVGGLLGDRIGRLNLLWPMTFLSGFLCLSLWLLAPTVFVLVLFICLFGFSSGVFVALLPPVVGQVMEKESIGARIGAFYGVLATAPLTGGFIGSAMMGKTAISREEYSGLIAYTGITMVIGSLLLLVARLLHDKDLRAKW